MRFKIDYTGYSEQRDLIYHSEEFSFDMEPLASGIDYDVVINKINLTVVDKKVIQLWGVCGLNKSMKSCFKTPDSKKGSLLVLDDLDPGIGSYRVNYVDWPVFVNTKTGFVCIGDPERRGDAVEFINNCIAVIDKEEFVSLWLKPRKL